MARGAISFSIGAILVLSPAAAHAGWRFTAATGFARSLPTRLTIDQAGFETLRLTARYGNRPFEMPLHWLLRVSRGGESAWELQHLHHKLYLRNRPPEVERFDISHGYNIVSLGWSRTRGAWAGRVGAGVVVAHPESTIRGRRFGPKKGILGLDQYLTGPAVTAGIAYRPRHRSRLGVTAEAQLTAARARVPIEGGHALAPNVALHVLLGIEWRSSPGDLPGHRRRVS